MESDANSAPPTGSARPPTARGLPEGTVTILFTDVVGSTELATGRGDEAAQEIMRVQRDLTRLQVEEQGGHEVKGLGDGFMVAFTTARQAVTCAVGIQQALAEHNRGQPPGEQVQVRIGLNTGEVIHEEEDLFGEAVTAAARIAAKAQGGQILVSDMVKGLLGRAKDVELVDRGRFRLKGFPERWRLFEVLWQEEMAVAPTLLERTPFVGREAERAELRRCLDQVAGGHGALVMIGGEPGVGKTRLAEELMAEARQKGMLTLTGHCYETEGAPPYIPFVETVEAAARVVPLEALREALGDSAPEVAKLMPELRRIFPDIPPPPELPPEQERRYLFNGMRDFLARAGNVQPMALLLDDLHWADDSTMLLIQHIAQQLHEMPLLLVGTYRDVELDVARPLARTLEDLVRQRLAIDVALSRLPEAGVGDMMRALSGQEPPQLLVDAVYGETEGNPFFVEEVYKHLAEEGKLFKAGGGWRTDLRVSDLDVPRGVRLVIGRRLERVSEECRRVLTSAAIIGRSFTFELLEALSEPDTDSLLDAVDEAERANLIASASNGLEARFTFAHELIRQTLVSGLSLPRRQRVHLRIAEAIERVYARSLDEHASDMAHHLYQAGAAADPEKTVGYLALAGDQAFAAAAFEDALGHYENALSLQPDEDRLGRAALLFKQGLALRSLGRWDEALVDWMQSLASYEKVEDRDAVGDVSYEASWQLIWVNRPAVALEVANRGLSALGEQASAGRCRLLGVAGHALSMGGDYEGAEGMLSQSLALAERLEDEALLGQALYHETLHRFFYMQVPQVVESGRRASELMRRSGNLWGVAEVLPFTQLGLLHMGRLDEAGEAGHQADELATRLGSHGALTLARTVNSYRELFLTGDLERFQRQIEEHLHLAVAVDLPWASIWYTMLGGTYFWRGQWPRAIEYHEEGARLEPTGHTTGADWSALFVAKAYTGDRAGALALLEDKRDGIARAGCVNMFGAWIALMGAIEGLAVLEEQAEAARLYPAALEAIDTGWLVERPLLTQNIAGIAAAAGRRWEQAEEHFQTALRQAHELPHKIEQPEVRRWHARMLIDRDEPGDREKARALLTEAIEMYRRIGMRKHVEMAEAMLMEV